MEKNVLLTISYDGTGFYGWQRQPDRPTIQGTLESTLSRLMKAEIHLKGTSRTDAGVHALGQRASFTADVRIPTEKLPLVVNRALAARQQGPFAISPIRVWQAEEKPLDFHARFDAKGKTYLYKIRNSGCISVFDRNYVYHVDKPLDVEAMREAAALLTGTHDFRSFEASGGNPRESTIRTISRLKIAAGKEAGDLEIYVTGDGFLYNMVRIITGTLVETGLGLIPPRDMTRILEAKDRNAAGHTAPPGGLYLAEVYYDTLPV